MIRDARGGHNRKKVNEGFFKSWSPDMAYVLGFMYADGALLNTNISSRTYYLQFSNNDLALLSNIRKSLHSDHKIYMKPPHIMKYKSREYLCKPGYVLRIGNKVMYQDLINLGMQHKKSNIMRLPEIPTEYYSYFMRGYFDGDGCISWYLIRGRSYPCLRVLFTSGSEDFLDKLSHKLSQTLCLSLGHIQRRPDRACNLIYQGDQAVRVLDFMYSDLKQAPLLEYKYKRYLKFKNELMGPRVSKALEKA